MAPEDPATDAIPRHGLNPLPPYVPPTRYAYGGPGREPICRHHTHDRPEVFWLSRGRCRHFVNGSVTELLPGALTFIRPADRHGMEPLDAAGFEVVNLPVPGAGEAELRRRYGGDPHRWPWWDEDRPRLYQLSREARRRLEVLVADLPRGDDFGLAHRDLVVLAAVNEAWRAEAAEAPREVPAWLRRGLAAEPDDPRALAAACEREIGHVNRTVRALYGCCTREFLLRRRLENAALDLVHADEGVAAVAQAHGFDNLAWFHRAFRARYGTTPRRYRLACRRPVNWRWGR